MISILVAIAKNGVIGKDNDLPWYYPSDLKYFKLVTTGHTVVMGRNTFESIINRNGRPLPNRKNVVVTRNKNFMYDGVEVVNEFIKYLEQDHKEEIFIIGGSEIFKYSIPYADRLYITHINKEYPGDVFMPEIDMSLYELISKRDEGELSYCVYERKSKWFS